MIEAKTTEQVVKADVMREFTQFIQTYPDETGEKSKYLPIAKEAIINSKRHIEFGLKDLMAYNTDLAKLIFDEYDRYEPVINEALTHFMIEYEKSFNHEEDRRDEDGRETYECSFDTGFEGPGTDNSVRGLKCGQLGKLITLRGTVTRTSEVRP